jgi:hypothetical protein
MGEQHRGMRRPRALSALLVTAIVSATPFVAASAAHAVALGPLTANNDSYRTTFTTAGTAFTVAAPGLLANDTGPVGTIVDLADSDITSFNGAGVSVHANGSFTYKPDPTTPFTGDDTFGYWIQDGQGNFDNATATIEVDPVIRNDAYYTHVNTTLNVATPGIFANDLGVDSTFNALWTADVVSAHGGAVNVNDDGSFSYSPPSAIFEGTDTFGYTASDINGDNIFPATVTVHVDNTAPTVAMTAPASRVTLSTGALSVAWHGSDLSGIARYDVQVRHAVWNGALTAWTMWKAATTATSAVYNGNVGVTHCFEVRATDHAGNVSGWSPERCSVVPMGAQSLAYSGSFTSQARSDVYGGVLVSTKTRGAFATRNNIHAKRIYLIATKCATCGTVQVRWNNVAIATVNLAFGATVHKQAFWVASFASAKIGTLTIVVTSATGKTVAIEGLGAYQE